MYIYSRYSTIHNFKYVIINMADRPVEISHELKNSAVCRSVKFLKAKRTKQRRLRRKRSKLKYFRSLREYRIINQRTNNLCASLSVFNITDMQSAPQDYQTLPKEVSDWQYFHQLAYWKSRAVSLEYENKMLHDHIKKMCTKEIENYAYAQQELECNGQNQDESYSDQAVDFGIDERGDQKEEQEVEMPETNRTELYGEFESKISGMETAMEVNYHMLVDNSKAALWPNIPLNL